MTINIYLVYIIQSALTCHIMVGSIKCYIRCTTRSVSLFLIISTLLDQLQIISLRLSLVLSISHSFLQYFLHSVSIILQAAIFIITSLALYIIWTTSKQCNHSMVNLLFPLLPMYNLGSFCILNLSHSHSCLYKLHHHCSNKKH